MFKPLPVFIGLRYSRSRQRQQLVSFVSVISMLGIALGVTALIVVLSVINASTTVMRAETLKSVPHASLRFDNTADIDIEAREAWLAQAAAHPQVRAVSPYLQGEAWLRFEGRSEFVQLRGIDPRHEAGIASDTMPALVPQLPQLQIYPEGIILGSRLAATLGVGIGDRLSVTALGSLVARRLDEARSFRVVGISDFGFYGNQSTALVPIETAGILFAEDQDAGSLRLRLHVDDVFAAARIASEVAGQLPQPPAVIESWDQTQGNLFNALRMEKRLTTLMLMMIVLIGAVNIVSTLVMVVADKRADIAILRTMGQPRGGIMLIFVTQGLVAALFGIGLGVLLGTVLSNYIERIMQSFENVMNNWFFPDQVYMISHLRAELQWGDVLLVSVLALFISLLATLYPAWRAARVQAAEVLRYE